MAMCFDVHGYRFPLICCSDPVFSVEIQLRREYWTDLCNSVAVYIAIY